MLGGMEFGSGEGEKWEGNGGLLAEQLNGYFRAMDA